MSENVGFEMLGLFVCHRPNDAFAYW